MPRLSAVELLEARVYWLLDLDYAGMTLRLSDAEVDVTTADGELLHYSGVLEELSVDEGIDFLSDASSSPATAAITAILPCDLALLVSQGHDLSRATGTLARWVEGTTWEARRVLVAGQVIDPEHGSSDEPTSFSLEAAPWLDTQLVPSPDQAVIGANWDDALILSLSAGELGLSYPVVIGRPGPVPTTLVSGGKMSGSQGIYVDHRKGTHAGNTTNVTLLIAGHHVSAERVWARTQTYSTWTEFKCINTYDQNRHPIAVLPWWYTSDREDVYTYDAAGSYTWSPASPASLGDASIPVAFLPADGADPDGMYICWQDDTDATAGGLMLGGVTIREAGDVLEYLLGLSGAPIDHGRFQAAKAALSAFKLDFTIDAAVTPWDFISANILPLLPISIVSGPDGLYPIVWRYEATADDAVCHLDTASDPLVERASNVSYDSSQIANDWTLNYALSIRTGAYAGNLRVAALYDSISEPSLYARLSQSRYRRADGTPLVAPRTIESPVIYAESTARAVLGWMSRAYAFSRRRVEYLVPEAAYGWLERGQVLTITDESLHFDRQVAILEGMETDGSAMLRLKLLIVENVLRDR